MQAVHFLALVEETASLDDLASQLLNTVSDSPNMKLASLAILTALPLLAAITWGRAQTPISALPYSINAQGSYRLTASLAYDSPSGNAITVNVGYCTIDLNGHSIDNLHAGPSSRAVGIYAHGLPYVTVQNGEILGFYDGIYFEGDSAGTENFGAIIQNMHFAYCGLDAILMVNFSNSVIRNCQIINSSFGVTLLGVGDGNLVAGNNLSHITNIGIGLGVGNLADGNFVTGASIGFDSVGSSKLKNNTATNCGIGYAGSGTLLPGTNF